jgi:tetratricopeptide (TPR) repeat protein
LVRYLPADDRATLGESFGELFYLMARGAARQATAAGPDGERSARLADAERWNRLAEGYGGRAIARAVAEQRADLARLAGRPDDADRLAAAARDLPPGSARDRFLLGFWYYQGGKLRQAVPELTAATSEDPHSFPAWFVRGTAHLKLEQPDLAAMCFTACIALRPDFSPTWVNRGLALVKLRFADLAITDYAEAIRLDPDRADAYILRAGVYANLGRHADAIAGYSAALECPDCPTRVYFYRAASRSAAGDAAGAAADRDAAMKRPPADDLSWVARASARKSADPTGALSDVEEALRVNPFSADALQMKAHLLAEDLNRPAEAIAALDRAVELYPDYVPARAGRGVLRARAGDRAGAIRDAEDALTRDSRPPNLYQVGCIYAQTAAEAPADRFKALELLSAALRGGFGREYLGSDPDLNPIRPSSEFRKLLTEFQPSPARKSN